MAKIKVLDSLTANMIAAGEVVERPSSAVKELIENSIDAHATRIAVEITDGGKTCIKVTDNGDGMEPHDAKNAFLRHATSKIHTKDDLGHIATLGFRGEALASIAAVSKVDLITRREEDLSGFHLVLEAGKVILEEEIGAPKGTAITISELFYNTPARMKFLKKDATEAAVIRETVEKLILSKPFISFRLIKDGREQLFSAGDGNQLNNIATIFSKEIASNLNAVDFGSEGIQISGYVGNENILRPNRKQQIFFVNDRCVRNKIFFAAVDEAAKEKATVGKYPFILLNIGVDYGQVDVNVHPTKAEVKFTDERAIYGCIRQAVSDAYQVKELVVAAKEDYDDKDFSQPQFETKTFSVNLQPPEENGLEARGEPPFVFREEHQEIKKLNLAEAGETFLETKTPEFTAFKPKLREDRREFSQKVTEHRSEENQFKVDYRIVGQIFNTYIVIEKDKKMMLLDQHAAHERLNYDKIVEHLKQRENLSSLLLAPVTVRLSPREYECALDNLDFFKHCGFDMEDFGNNSLIVREIPFDYDGENIEDIIIELCGMLESYKKEAITEKYERALYTMACKKSIKANMRLTMPEMEKLVKDVFTIQNKNTCPHGRPLFVTFEQYFIEKQFKRV